MESLNFILAREKCIRCNACVKDCPRRIIRLADDFPGIPAELEPQCIRCQHCLAICPAGAISIFGLKPENSLLLGKEPLIAPKAMSQFVRGRRTMRQYRTENVGRERIDRLLADTAHAPTGGNTCDLTFTVVDNRDKMSRLLADLVAGLEKAIGDGMEISPFIQEAVRSYRCDGTDDIFRGAPHLLIASAGEKAYCGDADVVIALSYFELLAQSHGLGTTWCDFLKFIFDQAPELAGIFGVPANRPYRAILFGLPAIRYARTVQRNRAAKIRTL